MRAPIVLDCEASGLIPVVSYPIEIGYVLEDGSVTSYLIKPEHDWLFWDVNAEAIHNITREDLKEGLSALEVAVKLNSQLSGETVYSDAVDYEIMWLDKLFSSVKIERLFDVQSLQSIIETEQFEEFYRTKKRLFENTTRHRAGNDAWVLQQSYLQSRNT